MNLKNIFVLHSLNGDTLEFWGKFLKEKLDDKIKIIMPIFPIRENSSYEKFDEILSNYQLNGELTSNSLVIAHSIANPYFIRYSARHNIQNMTYIAVAPGAVYEYPSTRNDYIVEVKKQAYLKSEELEFVKNNFNKIICFYSDEDDKNLEKFERFISDTGAEKFYLKGYNHFDGYHRIYQIPELIELVRKLIEK